MTKSVRGPMVQEFCVLGVGHLAQWESACLASVRLWVPSSALEGRGVAVSCKVLLPVPRACF